MKTFLLIIIPNETFKTDRLEIFNQISLESFKLIIIIRKHEIKFKKRIVEIY